MEERFGAFVWSKYVRFQKGENKTLVADTLTGNSMFISNECLDLLNHAEKGSITGREFIDSFLREEDRAYIEKLTDKLFNCQMLIKPGHNLISISDVNLSWDITNQCNLFCSHCCVSAGQQSRGRELSSEELINIADKLVNLKPRTICISGGEPLVREDFRKVTEYIRGNYSGVLKLMTNGTLIDEEMAGFISKHFYSVDISLDGINEETCSKLRGRGVFDNVVRGIRLLQGAGMERISASMVMTAQNADLREAFVELCRYKLKVYPMIRGFDILGRGLENSSELARESKEAFDAEEYYQSCIKNHFERVAPDIFTCRATLTEFQIDQKGDLYPCASLMDPEFALGNVLTIEDLSTYIETEEFKNTEGYRYFSQYLPYHFGDCESCNKNLMCFNCVRQIIRCTKSGSIKDVCALNKRLFELYWSESDAV